MEAPERARSMAARAARPTSNPGGSPEATRRLVNKAFLEALAEDFRQGGAEAIAKVRKTQPAAYMKICALLVPREMQIEHSGGVTGDRWETLMCRASDGVCFSQEGLGSRRKASRGLDSSVDGLTV